MYIKINIIKVDHQHNYCCNTLTMEHTLFNKIALCHILSLATVVMTTLSTMFLILMTHHHLVVAY